MGDHSIVELQESLRSSDAGTAWQNFLTEYSTVLYHTARAHAHDHDEAADCFLFLCEQLAQNNFRRLLKFNPKGPASFVTWLRVVARNLCMDWHRKRTGRPRPFRALEHFSALEFEVYQCRIERGLSEFETLQLLKPSFPDLQLAELAEVEATIANSLDSRQRWILYTRQLSRADYKSSVADGEDDGVSELTDPRSNQEALVVHWEQEENLKKCVASLAPQERLIIQLRFEENCSLEEIARLTGLRDAQRVHRHIGAILKKLRDGMAGGGNLAKMSV